MILNKGVASVGTGPYTLKNSRLLRRCKKFNLSRMNNCASTLNFFCFLHLWFLNGLSNYDFIYMQLRGWKER